MAGYNPRMSQGLSLKTSLNQSLVLAPQLQHSLQLLQAPIMELKTMVDQELEQNPTLEETASVDTELGEPTEESKEAQMVDQAEPPEDVNFDPATEKPSDEPADDFQAEFERLVQMDQDWRDHFAQTNVPLRASQEEEEKRQFMLDSLVAQPSLQEHLIDQVRLSELDDDQQKLAELVIGNIDDYGFLNSNPDELAFATNSDVSDLKGVIKVIQSFHPSGVGARDLRECLLLQLSRAGRENSIEYRIVDHHVEALGKRKIPEIARAVGQSIEEVQAAARRIAQLEPRPGRAFLPDNDQYILPEVFVTKSGDGYNITTNNEYIPHLRISNTYKDLMSQNGSTNEVRDYIQEKIRAGKFLIKSIHQRQQTILNIAREIVSRQSEFIEKGVAYLKPLTMVQVAEVVGVHETTVSRAVSSKYMQTPQGVFEMKYFFTSGIQTSDGAGMSNTSVKDKISAIFSREDRTKPLSDQEVVRMLGDEGIRIARRTVAKYRSELNILPSNLRKEY